MRPEMVWFLSDREREVLFFLSEGLTQEQIGKELRISTKTVNTHLVKIYKALGVSNSVLAVRCAIRAGLLKA